MLIRSRDKKTVLNIAEVAGLEIARNTIYPAGESRPTAGFIIAAILARYDGRVTLAEYESEEDALKTLRSIEQWIEQGGRGIFEIE